MPNIKMTTSSSKFTLASTIAKDLFTETDGYAYFNSNVLPTFKLLRTRTIYLTFGKRGSIGVSTECASTGNEYSFYNNILPLDTIKKELEFAGFVVSTLSENKLEISLPKDGEMIW